jgi:deoxyribodipyrimidine photo-lyase
MRPGHGAPLGGASRWWLDKSLRAHAAALEAAGSRLVLRRGEAVPIVLALAAELGAAGVYWSRSVEAAGRAQDDALTTALGELGVEARATISHLLTDPATVRTGSGGPLPRLRGVPEGAPSPA